MTKVAVVSCTVLATACGDASFTCLPPATRQTSSLGFFFVEASARQGQCQNPEGTRDGGSIRDPFAQGCVGHAAVGCGDGREQGVAKAPRIEWRKHSLRFGKIPRSDLKFCRLMSLRVCCFKVFRLNSTTTLVVPGCPVDASQLPVGPITSRLVRVVAIAMA